MGFVLMLGSGVVIYLFSWAFYLGFWLLGLGSLMGVVLLYSSVDVECLSELVCSSGLSISLVVMSMWVGGLSYACTFMYKMKFESFFSVSLFVLIVVSVMFFMVGNWLLIYFFFESSLIPILVLILGWGYQPERLQAASFMLMYTVSASLPLLVVLVYLMYGNGSMSLFVNCYYVMEHDWFWVGIMLVSLVGAFLVKLPVFMVHTWLPKAHVEAPVSGSMVLAGVLLKFGGYGIMMVLVCFFEYVSFLLVELLVVFVVMGGFFCSLMCLRQVDMKSLIAYSSIGHMALCVGGMFTCSVIGWKGGLVLMVAHGLCSPGLFALANFSYILFSSRSLMICSGVLALFPSLSMCWFLLCSSNMAFPPSSGLLGEVCLLMSLVCYSMWFMLPLGFMVFIAGVYSLLLYVSVQHGSLSMLSLGGGVLSCMFMTVSFLFWIPLNMITLMSDLMF